MKSVELNSKWNIAIDGEQLVRDLPYDVTANATRDYSCAFGANNGYIPAQKATFTRNLPHVKSGNGLADIRISGVCGYGEVYINDKSAGKIVGGYNPQYFPCDLSGAHNTIRIELFTSPAMSDKYLGLGIAGDVQLLIPEADAEYGVNNLFVKTAAVGGRTYADAELIVFNNADKPQKFVLECAATNARGKRAGKKQRKIFLRAGQSKSLCVRVRINNPYEWLPTDPYMYTMTVRLMAEDGEECTVSTRFGIVARMLSQTRGLYINNKKTLLMGAYLSHADVALGAVSLYCNEKRKLNALKSIGYNAVHYVGCPTSAVLDACDDVGMYVFVDLFGCLGEAKENAPLGGILTDPDFNVYNAVTALRNHPSVTVYGIADDVPECYDRYQGHELIKYLYDEIKALDDTRPITVSAHEFVPTRTELENAGCKKTVFESDVASINAGREKSLFENITLGAFSAVDVCGFNYLCPLYDSELAKRNRLILGARTSSDRAFESLDATEKNDRVIGDFNDCGMDYPGGGKLNENITAKGDLDAIACEKPQAVYKRILLGERNIAYIVVRDPDTDEAVHMWNWPRYLGQTVNVEVYTSGDVVALYLDGRIVGRKLAGKVNKHIASFAMEYYPGTLEAVAYFKGVECARSVIKSAGSPKAIKLAAYEKNLSVGRGDLGFVYVDVCDRDGELVPYAMRELTATVIGGELVSFVNADPMLRKNSFDSCPAYGGKALAVIRPDPGENKAVVKISGDGLQSARISFKIKN